MIIKNVGNIARMMFGQSARKLMIHGSKEAPSYIVLALKKLNYTKTFLPEIEKIAQRIDGWKNLSIVGQKERKDVIAQLESISQIKGSWTRSVLKPLVSTSQKMLYKKEAHIENNKLQGYINAFQNQLAPFGPGNLDSIVNELYGRSIGNSLYNIQKSIDKALISETKLSLVIENSRSFQNRRNSMRHFLDTKFRLEQDNYGRTKLPIATHETVNTSPVLMQYVVDLRSKINMERQSSLMPAHLKTTTYDRASASIEKIIDHTKKDAQENIYVLKRDIERIRNVEEYINPPISSGTKEWEPWGCPIL